ncbi:MAG: VOC family protein [Acidobacteria bacterium]|nr:VOC family protein [Acidobacteriota bacterium]
MRLHLTMIFVKDLPRMAAFYRQALGEVPVTTEETYVEFSNLALHAIPPHIAGQFEITSPPEPREDTPIKLIFSVPDVPAACQRLTALGAVIIPRPWGGFDALDPEGNVFGLR